MREEGILGEKKNKNAPCIHVVLNGFDVFPVFINDYKCSVTDSYYYSCCLIFQLDFH